MGIIIFGCSFFYFLFYGRSLIRPFINQASSGEPALRKREGVAFLLFIALVVLILNLDREIHWFAFVVGMVFGFSGNSDLE